MKIGLWLRMAVRTTPPEWTSRSSTSTIGTLGRSQMLLNSYWKKNQHQHQQFVPLVGLSCCCVDNESCIHIATKINNQHYQDCWWQMHKTTFAQIPLFQLPFSSLRILCRRGQRKQRTQGDLEQKKERGKEPKKQGGLYQALLQKIRINLNKRTRGFLPSSPIFKSMQQVIPKSHFQARAPSTDLTFVTFEQTAFVALHPF